MRVGVASGAAAVGLIALAAALAAASPPEYRIELAGGGAVAAGATGAASLTIQPARGRQISTDGPLHIELAVTPASGLTLSRHRLRRADAADPAAEAPRFEIAFRAEREGSYRISLDIRFWICGSRTCRPIRERRALEVRVEAPPPPPDAGAAGTD